MTLHLRDLDAHLTPALRCFSRSGPWKSTGIDYTVSTQHVVFRKVLTELTTCYSLLDALSHGEDILACSSREWERLSYRLSRTVRTQSGAELGELVSLELMYVFLTCMSRALGQRP